MQLLRKATVVIIAGATASNWAWGLQSSSGTSSCRHKKVSLDRRSATMMTSEVVIEPEMQKLHHNKMELPSTKPLLLNHPTPTVMDYDSILRRKNNAVSASQPLPRWMRRLSTFQDSNHQHKLAGTAQIASFLALTAVSLQDFYTTDLQQDSYSSSSMIGSLIHGFYFASTLSLVLPSLLMTRKFRSKEPEIRGPMDCNVVLICGNLGTMLWCSPLGVSVGGLPTEGFNILAGLSVVGLVFSLDSFTAFISTLQNRLGSKGESQLDEASVVMKSQPALVGVSGCITFLPVLVTIYMILFFLSFPTLESYQSWLLASSSLTTTSLPTAMKTMYYGLAWVNESLVLMPFLATLRDRKLIGQTTEFGTILLLSLLSVVPVAAFGAMGLAPSLSDLTACTNAS